jgi:hypothetical protein
MRSIASTTPDAGRWAEVRSGGGQADALPSSTFAASIEDGVGDRKPARGSQRSAAGRTKGSFEGDAHPAGSMIRPRPSSRTISRLTLLSVASQPSDPSDLGEGEDDVRRRDIRPREDDRERLDEVDPREPEGPEVLEFECADMKIVLAHEERRQVQGRPWDARVQLMPKIQAEMDQGRTKRRQVEVECIWLLLPGPETSAGAEAPNRRRGGSPRRAAGRRW